MSNLDPKLIATITKAVQAAMSQSSAATINPPAGLCQAGTSRNKLNNSSVGEKADAVMHADCGCDAPAPRPSEDCGCMINTSVATPQDTTSSTPNSSPVLSGWITAEQLPKNSESIVTLAPHARITPLARDVIRERKLRVVSTTVQPTAQQQSQSQSPFGYWLGDRCVTVDRAIGDLKLVHSTIDPDPKSQVKAIRDARRRIESGEWTGCVLFVRTAAMATCLCGRVPSLRPVVATTERAISVACEGLAANVLIIEHTQWGHQALRQMVQTFLQAKRPDPATLSCLTEVLR